VLWFSGACGLFHAVFDRVGMALSAKSLATSWTTRFDVSQAQNIFFLRDLVHTDSEIHLTVYPMGIKAVSSRVKRLGREVGHIFMLSIRMVET
jgi:predicted SpoU family rRNA methylase